MLLVAAVLGLVFADLLTKPAKTGNGVSLPGCGGGGHHDHDRAAKAKPAAPAGTQAPADVQTAAQAVATTVQAGLANATIRRGAGHLLMDLVTPLLGQALRPHA